MFHGSFVPLGTRKKGTWNVTVNLALLFGSQHLENTVHLLHCPEAPLLKRVKNETRPRLSWHASESQVLGSSFAKHCSIQSQTLSITALSTQAKLGSPICSIFVCLFSFGRVSRSKEQKKMMIAGLFRKSFPRRQPARRTKKSVSRKNSAYRNSTFAHFRRFHTGSVRVGKKGSGESGHKHNSRSGFNRFSQQQQQKFLDFGIRGFDCSYRGRSQPSSAAGGGGVAGRTNFRVSSEQRRSLRT